MRAWIFICTLTAASLPAVALAGDCPTCETSADCEALRPGEVTFCVQWDGPVGCGDLTRLCCPGQGCAIEGGRPSCEGDRCTVVEDLPVDAGMDEDAGTPGVDSGTPGVDSGTPAVDAGGTPTDAGSTAMDAGGGGAEAGGCGCHAVGARPGSLAWLALGAALLVLRRPRRSRA